MENFRKAISNRRMIDAGDGSWGARTGRLDRRSFLSGAAAGLGVVGLGGCMATDGMSLAEAEKMYGLVDDKKFKIPAADISKVDPKYWRRTVRFETKEAPGTIIV
ncbi:MAG: twin-arginine translocation signal domain-containing protein, partial [Rhodoblastus sp.]|nr:twin-arginine translocation signal domain-containing protein [Rhodoblastus sp.]